VLLDGKKSLIGMNITLLLGVDMHHNHGNFKHNQSHISNPPQRFLKFHSLPQSKIVMNVMDVGRYVAPIVVEMEKFAAIIAVETDV
jgi:hypothetical protein